MKRKTVSMDASIVPVLNRQIEQYDSLLDSERDKFEAQMEVVEETTRDMGAMIGDLCRQLANEQALRKRYEALLDEVMLAVDLPRTRFNGKQAILTAIHRFKAASRLEEEKA